MPRTRLDRFKFSREVELYIDKVIVALKPILNRSLKLSMLIGSYALAGRLRNEVAAFGVLQFAQSAFDPRLRQLSRTNKLDWFQALWVPFCISRWYTLLGPPSPDSRQSLHNLILEWLRPRQLIAVQPKPAVYNGHTTIRAKYGNHSAPCIRTVLHAPFFVILCSSEPALGGDKSASAGEPQSCRPACGRRRPELQQTCQQCCAATAQNDRCGVNKHD